MIANRDRGPDDGGSASPSAVTAAILEAIIVSRSSMESQADQVAAHAGSQVPIRGVQVLSRSINNLTVEVDQPTVYNDVLVTAPLLSVNNDDNNNAGEGSQLNNGPATLQSDISGTNQSSDESMHSEMQSETANRSTCDKDVNGRIPAYINFKDMEVLLSRLRDAPNPLLS